MSDLKERVIWHLAELFNERPAIRLVARFAGLSEPEIDFDGPPIDVWRNIFEHAMAKGQVAQLIKATVDMCTWNPFLLEVQTTFAADPSCLGTQGDLQALKVEAIARLAEMFVDQKIVRTIATHANLSLGNVDFDGRAIVMWTSVVEESIRQRRLKDLVHAAERIASVEDDPLFSEVCDALERDPRAFDPAPRRR